VGVVTGSSSIDMICGPKYGMRILPAANGTPGRIDGTPSI
jgi:hypothetical protein